MASGYQSLYSITTGSFNTALGSQALYLAGTSSKNNTAVGYRAGDGTSGNSFDNGTFLGALAGNGLTTGDNNVLIGFRSGTLITSGSNNITLGYQAGDTSTTGSDNIIIGHNVGAGTSSASYRLNIGGIIYALTNNGNVGIGTGNLSGFKLNVSGDAAKTSGGSWSTLSDLRLKDIQGSYSKGLSEIIALEPVVFTYKKNNHRNIPSDEINYGFIAQQVQPIFPEAIKQGTDGYLNFNIHPINVAMVNAVKELKILQDQLQQNLSKLITTLRLEVENTFILKPSGLIVLSTNDILEITHPIIRVAGNQGHVHLNSDLQIAPGKDSQVVIINGTDNNRSVTFNEGRGLSLTNSMSITLGNKDTLVLMYDAVDKEWIEISRSNKL
jgi:hypothetical protein